MRVNFAQPINDALKPILQSAINNVTLLAEKAKAVGARIGRVITLGLAAFKTGNAAEFFTSRLELGIAVAMDKLMLGLRTAAAFIGGALPPIFESLTSKLTDAKFWDGLENIFRSMGNIIGAEIQAALPFPDQKEIGKKRQIAGLQKDIGVMLMEQAGDTDLGAAVRQGVQDGFSESKKVNANFQEDPKIAVLRSVIEKLSSELKKPADEIEAGTARGTGLNPALDKFISKFFGQDEDEGNKPLSQHKVGSLTTNLGRVGGGGFGINFNLLVAVGNSTNARLTQVNKILLS